MKNSNPDVKPNIEKKHEILEAEFDPTNVGRLEEDNSVMGDSPFEAISHKLDTDNYKICGVMNGVVLGVDITESDDGWKVSKQSGLVVGKQESNKETSNKVIQVLMVGSDVEEISQGDLVACALDTGIKTVGFDGKELCLMRQENIFFKLERRDGNEAETYTLDDADVRAIS